MTALDWNLMSTGLSVGQVAGLIGGGTSIVLTTFPLLLAIILVTLVRGGKQNASSWTIIAELLHRSAWPFLLRTDSSRTKHVPWTVYGPTLLLTLGTTLLTMAHFLTPLPLKAVTVLERNKFPASFAYARDLTYFGQGTPDRPEQPISRLCGARGSKPCPGSTWGGTPSSDEKLMLNSSIPSDLLEILGSGTKNSTIAGPFDIQYRQWYYRVQANIDAGKRQAVGYFQPMQSIVLENSYKVIEGLIVDAVDGGVGIRNHTIPQSLPLGASWKEDILWIQPVTSCTPTNLTLHFSISNYSHVDTENGYLEDSGGFANLPRDIPEPKWNIYNAESVWNQSEPVPNLIQRSYIAAWWNNYFIGNALNVWNNTPEVGDTYKQGFSEFSHYANPISIKISDMNGGYYDESWNFGAETIVKRKEDMNSAIVQTMMAKRSTSNSTRAQNFTKSFKAYGRRCSGFDDIERSNSSKPYIRCGYVYSAPKPDTGNYRLNLGSSWSQSLYTCASAVKASVKTIEFSMNATKGLSDLQVNSIHEKQYSAESLPIWAVEKVSSAKNLRVMDINLLWGIVDPKYAEDAAIETRPGAELYLPACNHGLDLGTRAADTLASTAAFTAPWNGIYQLAAAVAGTSLVNIPSYSGESQYGMTLKWRELSKTREGVETMLNLIWTDLVAFTIVGTKTGFEGTAPTREVVKYHTVVRYDNMWFAIPAFIAGSMWVIAIILVIIFSVSRMFEWRTLRHYINQTSLGRAMTNIQYSTSATCTERSGKWADTAGKLLLNIPEPTSTKRGEFELLQTKEPEEDLA